MSRSNNNLYTPERLGEQKGEQSPFFHTPSADELKKMLLKSQSGFSYSDEESIHEFSTFFHKETREEFLREAQKRAKERTELAMQVADLTAELAKAVFQLASIVSPPTKKETGLLAASASRALRASEFISHIDTNILLPICNLTFSEIEYNIFFQIQKHLSFAELAEKHLEILPYNVDERRRSLLIYPPTAVTKHISSSSENYSRAKQFVTRALIDSTKAAKQNNFEKYNNILHNSAMHLHDLGRMLEASVGELKSKEHSV